MGISGFLDTKVVSGTDSSNASVTLVSADSAKKYRVYAVYVSSAGADEIELRSGSTVLLGMHLGANSGVVHNLHPFSRVGALNEALTLNKGTASTDVHYTIWYEEER